MEMAEKKTKEDEEIVISHPFHHLSSLIFFNLSKAMMEAKAITTTLMKFFAGKHAYDSYYESCEYKKKMKTALLKALHNLAVKRSPTGAVLMISIKKEVMGAADIAILDPKQLMEFVDLDNLDVVHILIWMKYLNNQFTEWKVPSHAYGFLSPKALSDNKISYEEQINSIARRLMSSKKLWLAPYNENMKHWVLLAIQVETKTVYWIDSREGKPSDSSVRMITDVFEAKKRLCPFGKYESNTDLNFITPIHQTTNNAPFTFLTPCGRLSTENFLPFRYGFH